MLSFENGSDQRRLYAEGDMGCQGDEHHAIGDVQDGAQQGPIDVVVKTAFEHV